MGPLLKKWFNPRLAVVLYNVRIYPFSIHNQQLIGLIRYFIGRDLKRKIVKARK